MKKLLVAIATLAAIALLAGCGGGGSAEATPQAQNGIVVENAFYFDHVNGHREETEMIAYVMFEFESLGSVKYQVSYVACTCRAPQVNYQSVAYVELSKQDGSISYISYGKDSDNHYVAGMFGDSDVTYEGVPNEELFLGFIEDKLMGASQDTINAMEPMHGDVDAFTGATVTPNNAVRMLQGLFEYHNARYM